MATFNLVMPKMGESVQEATITKWFKKAGDVVEEDDVLLEIATDKVDSEIPSPVAGKINKILFDEGALVAVGQVIAVIDLGGNESAAEKSASSDSLADDKKSKETTFKEKPQENIAAK
jgi:2-oxoglutarate dehydrogenase E2 component (dihydrolipoamide succinyltransferase)